MRADDGEGLDFAVPHTKSDIKAVPASHRSRAEDCG